MYNFTLRISLINKNRAIDDLLVEAIKVACKEASETANSKRAGRKYIYKNRIDAYSVKIQLITQTYVVPTRAISSITRALLRTSIGKELPVYKGSIISAEILDEGEEDFNNMQDSEIVQEIIAIFFGQTPVNNTDKNLAQEAANDIRKIVIEYKQKIRP